ncbi:MAG: phenylpropionate dioxygenase-like ring-hydroxylating dioxygenase large terminal subunit [Parasphingorhabdus sp.]|jgi:phenylpropionate dioxygenase-like ring-hydroxylating dioxygenase large terminal subunit
MNIPIMRKQDIDQQFSAAAEKSFTIPARYYHNEEIFQHEKEAVFYGSWWFVGHASQVAKSGQYMTASVQDQNVFVIRSRKGDLNAFYNVCQHRGHALLNGSGRSQTIVCPYHAWSYGHDGALRNARNSDEMVNFNPCDFSLKPIRVEMFCSMVFVNLDPEAIPLSEQAGELEEEIRHYCPRIDELVFAQRDKFSVKSNWKVLVDNFLECYHCDPAHKDFVDLVDMDSYRTITHGIYSSQCSGKARTTDNTAFKFTPGDVDFGYAGWFLWPNLTVWIYPGEPNISTLQMIPDGPTNTIEHQDWFIATAEPSTQLAEAMGYQKDVLQPEDIGLCESVQRGLKSKGYNQGRFVIDNGLTELSEHAVHHFQKLYMEAMDAPMEME